MNEEPKQAVNIARNLNESGYHSAVKVEAMLRIPIKGLRGVFADEAGKPMRPVDARRKLFNLKAKGVVWIPLGTRCPGFNDKTGCPGHSAEAQRVPGPPSEGDQRSAGEEDAAQLGKAGAGQGFPDDRGSADEVDDRTEERHEQRDSRNDCHGAESTAGAGKRP